MAGNFVMGAQINLLDNFTSPINQVIQATQNFGNAMNGTDSTANDLRSELMELTQAQRESTQAMLNAAGSIDTLTTDMSQLGNQADNTQDQIQDVTDAATSSQGGFSTMKKAILGAAAAFGAFLAVDKLKDFGLSAIEASASMAAMESQFGQVFDGMEADASSGLAKIVEATGMAENRLKGSFIQMAAFAKTADMSVADSLALSERATLAAADSAAFYDRSIEDVSDSLQSFLKGNYANDAALGISATETTRNAAAMKAYGKEFGKLSEAQKQLTLLQMVEDGNKLSGALGQAALEADAYENVVGNLKQSWTDFKIAIGGPLLDPFVAGLLAITDFIKNIDTGKIIGAMDSVKGFATGVKDTIDALVKDTGGIAKIWEGLGVPPDIAAKIELVAGALRTGFIGAIKAAQAAWDGLKAGFTWASQNMSTLIPIVAALVAGLVSFKVMTSIAAGFNAVKLAMIGYRTTVMASTLATQGLNAAIKANPFVFVASLIAGLVAVGILLYKNWDEISAWAKVIWGEIATFFSLTWANIKLGFTTFTTEVGALWTAFMGWLGPIVSAGLAYIQGIWDYVWGYLQTPVTILVSYVNMIISNFIAVITGIFQAGMALLQGDWEGAWNIIKGTGETILNNIMSFFEGINLFDTGKQIIQGLIDGIGSMVDAAASKVREVASGIKDSITGFFDIRSPSVVMEQDVGEMLPAGIMAGMDNMVPKLAAAAADMAAAATIPQNTVKTMGQVAPQFEGSDIPKHTGGVNVPASGYAGSSGGGGNTYIDTLVGKIELVASEGTDAKALLEQFMKLLYERLKNANEILGNGDRGALLG